MVAQNRTPMQISEESCRNCGLSLYYPAGQTQVMGLGTKHFHPMSYINSP